MIGSLRARYYVVVVGIATIPILLLGFFAGSRSANELERQSLALQTELAIRVEREIASFISARVNELRVLERTNVLAGMDRSGLSANLGRLLAHDQVYQGLFVLSPKGRVQVFASRTDVAPRDPSHWLDTPMSRPDYWADHDVYVGPVEFDAELREPLVDVAVPILERRTGAITNVLVAHARFRPIWDLLAQLDLPDNTEAFVVNTEGRILAHRSPAEVLSERVFEIPGESGRHRLADGTTALVATRALSLVAAPTSVVVSRPLESALTNAVEMRWTFLIGASVLLFGASVLAVQQSRAIVRPVEELAQRARQISAGDLETTIEVSGPEEINALGRTLQEMTSQLKQTIVGLKRSEFAERQRAMVTLQSIGDAVMTTDPDGHVTYINPVAERLTGWPLAEAVGRPLSEVFNIINETTRQPASNPVERCLASGKIVGLANHTALLSRDGHEFAISDSAAPIREPDGEVIGVVLVFQDDTDRRAMERTLRQSQKMEAIGQLSGGIAHDFNNLMQVIQGNAELLAEDPTLDNALTKPILRATERGAELTQRLLAYARKQPLMRRPIDVSDLLADMLPMLDRTLGEMFSVSLKTEGTIWPAETDPGQLETAILNLALNARDAMPDGGNLTIRCTNAAQADFHEEPEADLGEKDFVLISVEDTGVGMSKEVLEQAIDPFFTTKGVGEGSGLGLSMVYGFAMQTGGRLEIDSAEGAGTTVKMFLPRSHEPLGFEDTSEATEVTTGQGETVLVVEDDAEVRTFASRTLEGLGYQAVEASTVAEAHKILAVSQDIALVLTDVVLPGGNSGLDLARELARDRPDVPVIMISGYPDAVAAHEEAGGHAVVLLNKPFKRAQLASAVGQALDHPPIRTPS